MTVKADYLMAFQGLSFSLCNHRRIRQSESPQNL